MAKKYTKLEKFALRALAIIERHRDWNGDTVTEMDVVARRMKLGFTNNSGYFKRLPAGKREVVSNLPTPSAK